MNPSDLIDHVAQASGLGKSEAKKAVDAVPSGIADALGKGDEVRLAGFGSFKVAESAAREGRNPRTGEKIQIAASKAAKFSAGKALKDAVNG